MALVVSIGHIMGGGISDIVGGSIDGNVGIVGVGVGSIVGIVGCGIGGINCGSSGTLVESFVVAVGAVAVAVVV